MIHCPSCNHKEQSNASYCSQCGAQLNQGENYPSDDLNMRIESLTGAVIPSFPLHQELIVNSNVALLILNQEDIIPIDGDGEFVLGRTTEGQTILPDIDLGPYQAYQSGVSRLHADIHIGGSGVSIKDSGSANGTRLNGRRLNPQTEYILKNGDILTLGKLKIQVLIKT